MHPAHRIATIALAHSFVFATDRPRPERRRMEKIRRARHDTRRVTPPPKRAANQPACSSAAPRDARSNHTHPWCAAAAPMDPAITRARVSKGSGALPNDQGQVWREYDIRPYTSRVATTARGPSKPSSIGSCAKPVTKPGIPIRSACSARITTCSASITRPRCRRSSPISSTASSTRPPARYAFTLRVATVRNPNWRAKALPMMTPIPVQSPGVQGWLLAKENARLLVAELSRRTDYREYNSSQQLVNNGQSIVLSTMRPRSYIRSAMVTQAAWPGYQPEMGTIEEGFSLEFSPLLALDLASADAVVKLRLNQVEKMLPVKLDLPTTVAPNQRVQVDVPQMTMSNLHERFRWPTDRVLLLSMGVVATPGPTKDNPITDAVTDAVPMLKTPPRADALLFVESAGVVAPSAEPAHRPRGHVAAAVVPGAVLMTEWRNSEWGMSQFEIRHSPFAHSAILDRR